MNPFLLIDSQKTPILRIDLAPEIGVGARELFIDAAIKFGKDVEEMIAFDPGYQLQDGECFKIESFPISDELLAFCKQPLTAERLNVNDLSNLKVKGILGFDLSNGKKRLYFQNFDSRRVLIPGKRFSIWAAADQSTFQALDKPVIMLDAQLAAIWDDGTLKFKSFHLAKQIFDLSAYFAEATDEQINTFVTHKYLSCEDSSEVVRICGAWSRKKIALIIRGGALDHINIENIQAVGVTVGYQVPVMNGKIAVPTVKTDLKALLQFLDEDVYTGPISQRLLVSSGKREIPR